MIDPHDHPVGTSCRTSCPGWVHPPPTPPPPSKIRKALVEELKEAESQVAYYTSTLATETKTLEDVKARIAELDHLEASVDQNEVDLAARAARR